MSEEYIKKKDAARKGEMMSCSIWRWTKECDTHPCVGDCDLCSYHTEEEEEDELQNKSQGSVERM